MRLTDGVGARPLTAAYSTAHSAYTSVHAPCFMDDDSAYCSMGA